MILIMGQNGILRWKLFACHWGTRKQIKYSTQADWEFAEKKEGYL